jgi:hypothetical protein
MPALLRNMAKREPARRGIPASRQSARALAWLLHSQIFRTLLAPVLDNLEGYLGALAQVAHTSLIDGRDVDKDTKLEVTGRTSRRIDARMQTVGKIRREVLGENLRRRNSNFDHASFKPRQISSFLSLMCTSFSNVWRGLQQISQRLVRRLAWAACHRWHR